MQEASAQLHSRCVDGWVLSVRRAVQIRQKRGSSAVIEWALEQGLGDVPAKWKKLLHSCTAALLTAGAKTITHMDTYVARYEALMRFLLLKAGAQVCMRRICCCCPRCCAGVCHRQAPLGPACLPACPADGRRQNNHPHGHLRGAPRSAHAVPAAQSTHPGVLGEGLVMFAL